MLKYGPAPSLPGFAVGQATTRAPSSATHVRVRDPDAWASIGSPRIGLAVWPRPGSPDWAAGARRLLAGPDREVVAEGTPAEVAAVLGQALPTAGGALIDDVRVLAGCFAAVTCEPRVRLRFERLSDDACSCFHVDAVRLRLLCTYAGLGTEWQDGDGTIHQLCPGDVGLLKGMLFPDAAPRVPHRSPPVEHLPPAERARLLLVLDQPGVF